MICILAGQFSLYAQDSIMICNTKVTHLLCPGNVTYLQAGDPARTEAGVVPDFPNVVRLKATSPFEGESSLTLVCQNRVYSLLLNYGDSKEITFRLEDFPYDTLTTVNTNHLQDDELAEYGALLSEKKSSAAPVRISSTRH